MAKRKVYPEEFMNDACRLVADGMSITSAAKKVKIHHTMLRKWVKKSGAASAKTKTATTKPSTLAGELQAKIQQLQDEIAILEKARDILR